MQEFKEIHGDRGIRMAKTSKQLEIERFERDRKNPVFSSGYTPMKEICKYRDSLNEPRGVKAPLGPQGSDDAKRRNFNG